MKLDEKTEKKIPAFQKNEITEHLIYKKLPDSIKDSHSSKVLRKISKEESSATMKNGKAS